MANNKKILIVEDEPHVAEDISLKLKALDYAVVGIAGNGADAISLADHHQPDLILMDIVLPGDMDGIQAAAIIRDKFDIPIVYLSAYSDQQLLERAKITEPLAFILKPCRERELQVCLTMAFYKCDTEQQLQEKLELAATVVSLSEALIAWDTHGQIIRANDAMLRLLGKSRAELLGQEIVKMISIKDFVSHQAITEQIIYTLEKQGWLKDDQDLLLTGKGMNKSIPIRISGNRIQDLHMKCYGYVMLIRDDTERKRYEQLLQESDERFRQLADHIESMFFLSDTKRGEVIYMNQAYEKIFGGRLQLENCNDLSMFKNIFDEDIPRVRSLIDLVRLQQSCEQDFRILHEDGSLRWLNARCYPVIDPETRQTYRMACIIDDITERKKNEESLQQAAAIFDNTAEGILMTDPNLKIVAVNKAFTQITGYSEAEAIGRNPRIIKSERHDRDFYQNMWHAINKAGFWQGEIWNRRKNGEVYPQWMTINAIHDANNKLINYVSILSDISLIKESQEKLDYLAHHDLLTGFANRLLFNARLLHAISRAKRDKRKIAVLMLDLDRFKAINDSLGHAAGDLLLKEVAQRLSHCVREEDTLARLGGDEFIMILEGVEDEGDAYSVAQKIQTVFLDAFMLESREFYVTISIGISIYPTHGEDSMTLVKHADMAMYKAKEQGRNRAAFFSDDLTVDNIGRLTMIAQMHQSLERGEFEVYYQPQMELISGKIIGAEALVRWRHPEIGLVSPVEFIPIAEESGFIEPLGKWVLFEACRQLKAWQTEGWGDFTVAVNLSVKQIHYGDVVGLVREALEKTGLEARFLELEITESSLMGDAACTLDTLIALKALGVKISIDDFGTGYSSLSYLKRFPVDKLKIDRSFIMDIPNDHQDMAISLAILALGRSLALKVIAEGVETGLQNEFLKTHQCDEVQGFFFSRPVPGLEFRRLFFE